MRILVANIPLPFNRFLVDLNAALSKSAQLVHSSDEFWNMQGAYDVVHLHFPEYLTFELQDAYIHGLDAGLIESLRQRLEFWANRSVIVVTRHVLLPHDAREDPMWEKLYETVYSYADGVVHFATASIREFEHRYAKTAFFAGQPPQHTAVPHQNYASLPNTIRREQARAKLGLDSEASVLLAFGAIRNAEEQELLRKTFEKLDIRGKVLLVSQWRENLANVSWIRLKYWIRDLKRLYYRLHPQFHFNYGFVAEEDAQYYLNAADVLFIPRLHVLNSGNVTLGMTFGRVVVGPDSYDVGELLRETGNPVFDPDRPETAVNAVLKGFGLAREGRTGQLNRERALRDWTVEQCASRYIEFFSRLNGARQKSS